MKTIILFAILSLFGMLMLQGCNTAPATSVAASAKPAIAATKEAKKIELDPLVIMTNSNLGNCTACHAIPAKEEIVAGDIGPPFSYMKLRFEDFDKLRAAIYDQRALNSETIMPPFGRNNILTPEQIDAVALYIYQF